MHICLICASTRCINGSPGPAAALECLLRPPPCQPAQAPVPKSAHCPVTHIQQSAPASAPCTLMCPQLCTVQQRVHGRWCNLGTVNADEIRAMLCLLFQGHSSSTVVHHYQRRHQLAATTIDTCCWSWNCARCASWTAAVLAASCASNVLACMAAAAAFWHSMSTTCLRRCVSCSCVCGGEGIAQHTVVVCVSQTSTHVGACGWTQHNSSRACTQDLCVGQGHIGSC